MIKIKIIKSKGMILLKKYLILSIILIILTIFYLYIANVSLMPKSITLLQGEKLKLATLWGVELINTDNINYNQQLDFKDETLEASVNINENKISNLRKNRHEDKNV